MAKTVADVIKMVKDNEIKFVDFRFTDTRGKEQHVTVPVSHFDEDKFSSGHAFDGSSIAGWKGIEASDMLLMPDANTANIDPFFEEPTLILTCDVVDPADGKAYERDPRSLAKRAEAYMKASGLGDTAYFGPEPEFFVFDSVRRYYTRDCNRSCAAAERATVTKLSEGIHRVIVRYGFMESPHLPRDLAAIAATEGLDFDPLQASYFLGRETLVAAARPKMPIWRLWLFLVMARNAISATEFFRIPTDRVVELGVRVAI